VGKVLAYPPARRVAFIARQVQFVRGMSRDGAEHHLARIANYQRQALTAWGVDPDRVEVAVFDLQSEIRSHLWRAAFGPGARS